MIKLLEIATTVVIIFLGTKIGDYYKADLIELHLLNGNIKYVKVSKNNNYSCPQACAAHHFHDTLISEDIKTIPNYNLVYNNREKNILSLNGIDVITVFEIIEKKKNKKNKISKIERNRLDIKNFINKYD